MKNGSITDWIQAVAVVIGIYFVICEFVIHDRQENRDQKVFTSEMILSGSVESVHDSISAILSLDNVSFENLNVHELVSFKVKLIALDNYMDQWGFCYEHSLCDRELALNYMCLDIIPYAEMENVLDKVAEELLGDNARGSNLYKTLLSDCLELEAHKDNIADVKSRAPD